MYTSGLWNAASFGGIHGSFLRHSIIRSVSYFEEAKSLVRGRALGEQAIRSAVASSKSSEGFVSRDSSRCTDEDCVSSVEVTKLESTKLQLPRLIIARLSL